MSTAERCEFLHVFPEAVYVDVVRKEIVGVAAKPAFRHLFAAGEGSVKAASAPEGADSDSVTGDPEGNGGRRRHKSREGGPEAQAVGHHRCADV